jgi:hypothetical protein
MLESGAEEWVGGGGGVGRCAEGGKGSWNKLF